jgi:ribonuclease HI
MQSTFKAELNGVMRAIEIAANKNWSNLWIETDSNLVVLAFKSSIVVPWDLSNRLLNCIWLTTGMNFVVTHVYREGNQHADGLANIGLTTDNFTIWYEIPSQILGFFADNRLDKPSFRFMNA